MVKELPNIKLCNKQTTPKVLDHVGITKQQRDSTYNDRARDITAKRTFSIPYSCGKYKLLLTGHIVPNIISTNHQEITNFIISQTKEF